MIMENFKIPFAAECLRTKRVENYLYDLNVRLRQLRRHHDEIIEKSMSIIKEFNEVTASIGMVEMNLQSNRSNIQDLIHEFESVPVNNDIGEKNDLRCTGKLEDSEILKESFQLLKYTKGSLKKIETFLKAVASEPSANNLEEDNFKQIIKSNPLRKKDSTHFASCCSSTASLKVTNGTEQIPEQIFHDAYWSITDIGYQGDIDDSEYDLLAADKKKKAELLNNNLL